jgi:hypothetical protein
VDINREKNERVLTTRPTANARSEVMSTMPGETGHETSRRRQRENTKQPPRNNRVRVPTSEKRIVSSTEVRDSLNAAVLDRIPIMRSPRTTNTPT